MKLPDPQHLSEIGSANPWRPIPDIASVRIETPRLILDDFRANDIGALHGIFGNLKQQGQSWFNASADRPGSVEKLLETIIGNQHDAPRHTYRLAIRKKEADGSEPLVGYVSLCDIHSKDSGKPDTGVLVDPAQQRGGFGREARVAQMVFGFGMGLERMVCDIKTDNTPSKDNVIGMGYSQILDADGKPLVVKTHTLRGEEDWHRFAITHGAFVEKLPGLVHGLQQRYWSQQTITPMTPQDSLRHAIQELTSRLQGGVRRATEIGTESIRHMGTDAVNHDYANGITVHPQQAQLQISQLQQASAARPGAAVTETMARQSHNFPHFDIHYVKRSSVMPQMF